MILPCFLYVQHGMTPVLRAALEGHTSIIELLVDQYHCSLTDVDNVSALDVLQCSHAPLRLVGLILVPTSLESSFFLFTSTNSHILTSVEPQILWSLSLPTLHAVHVATVA